MRDVPWDRTGKCKGETPAIALIDPKYAANVAKVLRLASCFGMEQVWFTGRRIEADLRDQSRLPREERMKGYKDVKLIQDDRLFDRFDDGVVPVAVEVRDSSESLADFWHPEDALYVFGPEDGSIPKVLLRHCHRFIVIPTRHCLNLATAVSVVCWDRQLKEHLAGKTATTPGEWENRGYE